MVQQAPDSVSAFGQILDWLGGHPYIASVVGVLVVFLLSYIADRVAKRIVLATINRVVRKTSATWDDVIQQSRVFERLVRLVPALAIYFGITIVPGLPDGLIDVVQRAAAAAMILIATLSASALLSAANDIYDRSDVAGGRTIKGYVQVIQIALYVVGGITGIATIVGRSPLVLLGGLGAATAVLMLVFKDTILSFVASLQLSNYDMVRVGDWIEMPKYGVDGDVLDVALHTVKVRNWDNTVTTVPTNALIADSFKNWRAMSESGGRRIKRAVYLDMNTVKFLDDEDIERFERFELLRDYIKQKKEELAEKNIRVTQPEIAINQRHLTNVGTFRAYIVKYLRDHPQIHQAMTLLVRQLDPTPHGLPIQIYVFTNDTGWVNYEGIQSDIFDHILSIAPEFDLRIFQEPSGRDLQTALGRM